MSLLVRIETKAIVGQAVFAITNIRKDTVVISSKLEKVVPNRDKYSLELNGKHIIMNEPAVLVNHSCDPNCMLVPNQAGAFDFIAIRDIQRREEITFDYESIESEITAFSTCLCEAKNCRGQMNTNKKTLQPMLEAVS